MKHRVLTALGFGALLMASSANAQLTGSVGYMHLSDDVDVGAVYGTIGYRIPLQDDFYFVPEFRIGAGVNDDTESVTVPGAGSFDVITEIDNLYGISGRLHYELAGGTYLLGIASYTRFSIDVSTTVAGINVTGGGSTSEFGIGAGAGYMFSDSFGVELVYENISSTDVISAGLRFRF